MKIINLFALAALLAHSAVQAATLVEISARDGNSRIYKEGHMARLEMPGEKGYMVIDTDRHSVRVVMPQQKIVLDLSDQVKEAAAPASGDLRIRLEKQGKGAKIAGYETTHYTYLAGDKTCGTIFASTDALNDAGLAGVFEIMERMASKAQAMAAPFRDQSDPCETANVQLSTEIKRIGAPLRTLDADGKQLSEVTSIDTDAKLPAGAFDIPADYKVEDTASMLQKARQNAPSPQQIEQMMKQMQESGQMPPEAMEQMRQMQQQMMQQGQ